MVGFLPRTLRHAAAVAGSDIKLQLQLLTLRKEFGFTVEI